MQIGNELELLCSACQKNTLNLLRNGKSLFFLGPTRVAFGYFGGFGVPLVKEEAIPEGNVGSLENPKVTRALRLSLEIVYSKWIGGDKSVVSGMPPSGMAKVGWMIENGETSDSFLEWSPV